MRVPGSPGGWVAGRSRVEESRSKSAVVPPATLLPCHPATFISPDQIRRHEQALARLVGPRNVLHAIVEADDGVAGEQRVELEPGQLGDAVGGFLDRAVVDVLQHDPSAAEDRVSGEEIAALPTVQQIASVAIAVPRRVEDREARALADPMQSPPALRGRPRPAGSGSRRRRTRPPWPRPAPPHARRPCAGRATPLPGPPPPRRGGRGNGRRPRRGPCDSG